ncbi:hypothetical protein HMN09_00854100 [Mycena chlorophos]|uniref:Uncharacterized protein n=1 Tax=Mycena chlorophos TaxID=658473 RepID=A0A8H6SSY2_MYCCL|nr:hypothetical protein HMN09_00854100 [Mycena chlorophos]
MALRIHVHPPPPATRMTRCASPNGAVEFSYDFPVASTTNTHLQRPRSPRRRYAPSPVRRSFDADDDEGLSEDEMDLDDDEDTRYDVYPKRATTHPIPRPTPTGNQWTTRAPSPSHLSPFYPTSTSTFTPASYESERSVLSSLSHDNNSKRHCAITNKIRKPRRSVDEPSPSSLVPPSMAYASSSGSSAPSSPYSIASDDFSDLDDGDDALFGSPEMAPSELPAVDEEQDNHQHHETGMAIKKQWTALSMRVRFGVFRAKRRMRDRVLSL